MDCVQVPYGTCQRETFTDFNGRFLDRTGGAGTFDWTLLNPVIISPFLDLILKHTVSKSLSVRVWHKASGTCSFVDKSTCYQVLIYLPSS